MADSEQLVASQERERLGRYEVLGRLATGGMAEILLARVVGPQGFVRAVVVKRILDHLAAREDFRAMFLDEASIVSRIHHDNVVQVNELGEEDGQLFLAMEYLQGESAAGLMRRLLRQKRRLPLGLAAYIVGQAAAGLHAAHELTDESGDPLGLVHRDASPHNLFVTYDGAIKVLDFGIAHAAGRFTQTEAGQIKGKFAYMSPEQCRGQQLDRRSDVFALGIVLYELMTARRLFVRDNDMATMRAVCKDPIQPPDALIEDCPQALGEICMKALERARSSRFDSADELSTALRDMARRCSDRDPQAELAALMREVFGDRMEKKAATLRRLRAGETISRVSPGEVDHGVMIPTVESPQGEVSRSTAVSFDEPPARRPHWGAVAGLLAVGGAAAFLVLPQDDAPKPTPVATVQQTIELSIVTQPPAIEVWLDETRLGLTPLTHRVPAGSREGRLVLRGPGFVTHEETVAFDVSQRIAVTMKAVAVPEVTATSAPSSSVRPGAVPDASSRALPARPVAPRPVPPSPAPARPLPARPLPARPVAPRAVPPPPPSPGPKPESKPKGIYKL